MSTFEIKTLGRRSLKITFVGAHGTGKTTLVRALSQRISEKGISCTMTDEVPRVVCESAGDPTFFRRGNNSLAKQSLLLIGQPIYEAAATLEGAAVVLCDRSILDHWAYTRCLFMDDLRSEGILAPAGDFVSKYCETYDAIFYVPIEFASIDDGTREGDPTFQQAIDSEIRALLNSYNIQYHTIKGTVDERVDTVLKKLEDFQMTR
jgi:nicotinamide riboside kinase